MKKIFSLVLAAVILVSFGILAGCEDNPQNNSASDSANGDNIVVQVANPAALPAADAKPTGWDTEWSKKLGIKLVQEFDSSGEPAWDVEKHPNVFITTEGPGYGGLTSKVTKPGVTIIDSDTNEVITSRHYDIGFEAYFEPHGLGVSENGKWIYLPTGDANAKIDKGRWLVIDAKTLKLHQIIQMRGNPHHAKVFRTAEGKSLILGEDFNWTNPGTLPGSGIYAFDPDDNNRVVGGIDASTLQANPYLAFPDPASWCA